MDAGVLMDRDDVLKDWPNKKDSDIAEEIFRAYGLDAVVTDTSVVHDEEVSTIIQRETDMQFLRPAGHPQRLRVLHRRDHRLLPAARGCSAPAQAVLAIQFGDQTTTLTACSSRSPRWPQHRGRDVPGRPRLPRRCWTPTADPGRQPVARRDGLARLPPAGPGAASPGVPHPGGHHRRAGDGRALPGALRPRPNGSSPARARWTGDGTAASSSPRRTVPSRASARRTAATTTSPT